SASRRFHLMLICSNLAPIRWPHWRWPADWATSSDCGFQVTGFTIPARSGHSRTESKPEPPRAPGPRARRHNGFSIARHGSGGRTGSRPIPQSPSIPVATSLGEQVRHRAEHVLGDVWFTAASLRKFRIAAAIAADQRRELLDQPDRRDLRREVLAHAD